MMSGLPRVAARERAAEVLRHVGLAEERYRPMGGYSTGMKQKAKLAQALAHDPKLVMLDEPTNGLDPRRAARCSAWCSGSATTSASPSSSTSHLLGEPGAGERPRRRPRRRPACCAVPDQRDPRRYRTLLVEVLGDDAQHRMQHALAEAGVTATPREACSPSARTAPTTSTT